MKKHLTKSTKLDGVSYDVRGFNWHQSDHFRIVYLPRVEDLQLTTDSLASFLSTYQQR